MFAFADENAEKETFDSTKEIIYTRTQSLCQCSEINIASSVRSSISGDSVFRGCVCSVNESEYN